jgi:dihydrofolate reductase
MQDFDVVVATDSRGGIGRRGTLPWGSDRGGEDLRYFRALTSAVKNCAAVAGGRTDRMRSVFGGVTDY